MSTETYSAGSGQGLTWGNAITGTTLNGLGNGNAVLSDIQIDNSVALDMFADVSISLASQTWSALASAIVLLYPLNQDGSTYGDGRFGSATAIGATESPYLVGTIHLVNATQAQHGILRGILIPPGKFKFVFVASGGSWPGSGNTAQYRTYNRQVA